MKSGLIAVLTPLAFLACAPVHAEIAPSASTSDAAAAPAKAPKEKRICRSEEDTSSIIAKRVCHTKAEWSAIDDAQQSSADAAALQRSNQRR